MRRRLPYKVLMKKYIIWDWNGTIIDDVGIALAAVNDMLETKGRRLIDLEEYRRAMDTPILRFYEQFFNMEETSFPWIAERFQEYYASCRDTLSLHEGVEAALGQLHEKGCRQIVLSSSATSIIQDYAMLFGVQKYFEAILGADNLLSTGKIERAVAYFQSQQIPRQDIVLIGDTVHDYDVAQALGVDCILLSYGHQDKESLQACGCPVYDTLAEILSPFGK